MKKHFIISSLSVLVLLGLNACDLFDKAGDISFSSDIQKSLTISNAPAGTYSDNVTLDATTDSEINKYKEKIKDISVNKITYNISNYTGPTGATFSGEVLFGSGGSMVASITNLNLLTASTSGEEFELALDQNDIDAISATLKDSKTILVFLAGTFSDGPVSFIISFTIDAKVTANPL